MSAINTSNGLVVLNHTFTHNVEGHAKCVMLVNMLVSDIDISVIHTQIVKNQILSQMLLFCYHLFYIFSGVFLYRRRGGNNK